MSNDKPQFSKGIFWDVDSKNLDYDKCDKYVIERVVQRGLMQDWQELKNYYGLEKIKNITLQSKYLDNTTLNFLSFYFNITKEQFRCYTQKQLTKELWPY